MRIEWVERQCPLCGSAENSTVFAESNFDAGKMDEYAFASRKLPEYMHARLMQCSRCDVLYTNPAMSAEALAAAYRLAAFDSQPESRSASVTYRGVIDKLLPRLPDRNAALDLGTGDVAFLEQLIDQGFQDVVGIEPSAAPIAAARPNTRKLIREGVFRPEDFQPASFSLITCFQVMEHVWDPLSLCRGACSLLKPGGAFVAIVHNWRAWSRRLLGRKSPIFDIEHLQLFSPKSAVALVELASFGHTTSTAIWNRYPLDYWMKLFPFPRRMKPGLMAATQKFRISRVPVSLPAGNLAVVAFKPHEKQK
jgi:SAM-dependent methyltransferase